jgi:hypothetical protein
VDRHIREARVIFAQALDDDIIRDNPFKKLGGAKPVKKEWYYVAPEEFDRLLSACNPSWQLLLGLARWAGLRAEEALRLPWRKVDLVKQRLSIEPREDWKPKDGEKRTLPIGERLLELLERARGGRQGEEMVIPAGTVVESNIWRDFGSVCRRAGVPRYPKPMHALRKSCITDWASAFPAHVVMEWAGHADYRTTVLHYLKVSEADYERAAGLTGSRTEARALEETVELAPLPESGGAVAGSLEGGRLDVADPSDSAGGDGRGPGEGWTQKRTQKGPEGPRSRPKSRAGEGIRTPDVQLGKLAFYH